MKTLILIVCAVMLSFYAAHAQTAKGFHAGIEQDPLPYLTGGYYGAAWIGKNRIRLKALTASVHKPSFIVPDGFENNHVSAFALMGEYFLKENWQGWSLSTGIVSWRSSIQRTGYDEKKRYDNLLLHGGLSYTIRLYHHLYCTPWAGMHMRIGGAKEVTIEGKTFTPALLNPEASLRIGYWL